MASFVYNDAALKLVTNSIVWASDTIKIRLISSAVTPDKDDTSMTGMTQIGGSDKTLTTVAPAKDTTNDRIVFDANDPSAWSAVASGTVGGAIVFKFVTNDAGSIPIAFIDPADIVANGSDISVTFASTGCFYLQQ